MGMYQAVRGCLVKAPFAEKQNLQGKTAIVTGCAQGSIGFATAKTLALWGAKVIITTRTNAEKLVDALRAATQGGQIDGHVLETTSAESVAAFSAWFQKNHGERLDILVNNVGVHFDLLSQWKEPHLTADGFEIQWRTNYLGVLHLTHLLLPDRKSVV